MELLVALVLGGVVLAGLAAFLMGTMRWAERLTARAEALEVARTVWVVLDEELRPGLPGRDWSLSSERAVELRAFRGVGRLCGPSDGGWAVAYRGLRAPDPSRDSLLVLGDDGGWRAVGLEAASAGGELCEPDPGEESYLMTWPSGDAPLPLLIRVFERGRYSLEEGAFRYRRGAGGRQPLTPERVDPESRFEADPAGIRVRLRLLGAGPAPGPTDFEWVVGRPGAGGA